VYLVVSNNGSMESLMFKVICPHHVFNYSSRKWSRKLGKSVITGIDVFPMPSRIRW
jgi:hypothetical protein